MRGNCIGGGMPRSGRFEILLGGIDWASASLSQPEETPPIATGFDFAQPLLVGGTISGHHLAPKTIVWPKPTNQVAERQSNATDHAPTQIPSWLSLSKPSPT
jgi:hypothetical protein